MPRFSVLALFCHLAALAPVSADEPLASGLTPGQRPGPYSSLVAVGQQRGQLHCFICETENRPAAIIFARTLSEPLGKLAHQLDQAVLANKAADLRGWITVLNEDHLNVDTQAQQWARKHAVRSMSVGVYEDAGGPATYRLARGADVTVLLFVNQKVVRNFAFRAGELSDERIAEVVKALPEILPQKK
jgi:hypothetical protein